ncbi:MAG: putative monovalent cation/H+ antiporter subunit A [Pirellulaceae bacterium]
MLISLLAIVLAAVAAPWLHHAAGSRVNWAVNWALAGVPLAIFAFFVSWVEQIHDGEIVSASVAWVPSLGISLSFYLDGLSLLFALLITGIGTLVVIYAGGYLAGDSRLGLFSAFLFLFMGSMLGLALADNVMTLFVFWELTSISSYLLIGFDHARKQARAAALQSLLVTGGGGLALLAGLLLLGQAGGTFDLSVLRSGAKDVRQHALYVPILLLILAGAFTKSAQFPFHFWLPSAMEAPTPVSAYLHSATMVNAGVYAIARLNPILGGTAVWFYVITLVGGTTTLLGAYMAFRATDLKRILAYSTISVLGTLTMLLGVGTELAIKGALSLLLAHALYKGAMFLIAGSVSHAAHQRDIRRLGGLGTAMPFTMTAAVMAGLSMAGLPPTFGFIGKELYYDAVGHAAHGLWQIVALPASMLLVAATALVCIRPFGGPTTEATRQAHEVRFSLWMPPALLGALGLLLGVLPEATAQRVVGASVGVVAGAPVRVELGLWHGVNLTLLLSIVTLAGGGVLYRVRNRVPFLNRFDSTIARYGPAQWYQFSLDALNRAAVWQTRVLQNGYLRFYLLTIIGTTLVLVWTSLRNGVGLPLTQQRFDVRIHELVLAGVILAAALVAVRSGSRLTSIAALGVVGYCVAAIFVLFSAPDLAMTQFVIETLTVILLLLVFFHLPDFKRLSTKRAEWRDALLAAAAGGTITVLLLFATTLRTHLPVSHYFVQHSVSDAHGRNIVNVILVDFRALDTLGEITVLAIAGIGVYALLKLRIVRRDIPSRRRHSEPGERLLGREPVETARDGRRHPDRSAGVEDGSARDQPEEVTPWIR